MHSQSNSGIRRVALIIIVIIILAILLSALIAFAFWTGRQFRTPTITVSGVSLNPHTIKQHQSSTLSFTIKNNDETRSHQVQVEFNATASTLFSINNASLPFGNNGLQYYNMTLQSSQQSTYSFKVLGTLTGGATTSTYSIPFSFYYQNGTRFDTERVSLTVNS